MSMRGVHFAISDSDLCTLLELQSDEERIDYVNNEIEEAWDANFAAQSDKAWALIHSTLTGGDPCAEEINLKAGMEPDNINPFGHEYLISDETAYVIGLVRDRDVRAVRDALEAFDSDEFSNRLSNLIASHSCADLDEEAVAYAAGWFENVKTVYRAAVKHGRHVIFTVDW